jgi:hypothetical protein
MLFLNHREKLMNKKTFTVRWVAGDDIGPYEAEDGPGAILAAVQDAGDA